LKHPFDTYRCPACTAACGRRLIGSGPSSVDSQGPSSSIHFTIEHASLHIHGSTLATLISVSAASRLSTWQILAVKACHGLHDSGVDVEENMPPRLPIRLRNLTRDNTAINSSAQQSRKHIPKRDFTISCRKRTDGVFRELTNARLAIPWSEALRKRDAGEKDKVDGTKDVVPERNLEPKRMKDSYHSVVCCFLLEVSLMRRC
jgi:hypothetical protein